MLNRRLIRIKVFQFLFSNLHDKRGNRAVKSQLEKSLTGLENTFINLLVLPVQLADHVEIHFNPKDHYVPSDESIRAFKFMTGNSLVETLRNRPEIKNFLDKGADIWNSDTDFLGGLYQEIRKTEFHKEFIQEKSMDAGLYYRNMYAHLLNDSADFDEFMEDQSFSWNDDRIPIAKNLIGTIDKISEGEEWSLPELSKDLEEDLEFAFKLYERTADNQEELTTMLVKNTPGWDKDRITKTDHVLMQMAVSEFLYFPYVPIKVTINEYLELAKNYSTPKSSKFLNGTLDKVKDELTKSGAIQKKGRGLLE